MKGISLKVTVDSAGHATVDVGGVTGPGCLDATRAIEEALGDVQSRKHKPEYFQRVSRKQSVKQNSS